MNFTSELLITAHVHLCHIYCYFQMIMYAKIPINVEFVPSYWVK